MLCVDGEPVPDTEPGDVGVGEYKVFRTMCAGTQGWPRLRRLEIGKGIVLKQLLPALMHMPMLSELTVYMDRLRQQPVVGASYAIALILSCAPLLLDLRLQFTGVTAMRRTGAIFEVCCCFPLLQLQAHLVFVTCLFCHCSRCCC